MLIHVSRRSPRRTTTTLRTLTATSPAPPSLLFPSLSFTPPRHLRLTTWKTLVLHSSFPSPSSTPSPRLPLPRQFLRPSLPTSPRLSTNLLHASTNLPSLVRPTPKNRRPWPSLFPSRTLPLLSARPQLASHPLLATRLSPATRPPLVTRPLLATRSRLATRQPLPIPPSLPTCLPLLLRPRFLVLTPTPTGVMVPSLTSESSVAVLAMLIYLSDVRCQTYQPPSNLLQ